MAHSCKFHTGALVKFVKQSPHDDMGERLNTVAIMLGDGYPQYPSECSGASHLVLMSDGSLDHSSGMHMREIVP